MEGKHIPERCFGSQPQRLPHPPRTRSHQGVRFIFQLPAIRYFRLIFLSKFKVLFIDRARLHRAIPYLPEIQEKPHHPYS